MGALRTALQARIETEDREIARIQSDYTRNLAAAETRKAELEAILTALSNENEALVLKAAQLGLVDVRK